MPRGLCLPEVIGVESSHANDWSDRPIIHNSFLNTAVNKKIVIYSVSIINSHSQVHAYS